MCTRAWACGCGRACDPQTQPPQERKRTTSPSPTTWGSPNPSRSVNRVTRFRRVRVGFAKGSAPLHVVVWEPFARLETSRSASGGRARHGDALTGPTHPTVEHLFDKRKAGVAYSSHDATAPIRRDRGRQRPRRPHPVRAPPQQRTGGVDDVRVRPGPRRSPGAPRVRAGRRVVDEPARGPAVLRSAGRRVLSGRPGQPLRLDHGQATATQDAARPGRNVAALRAQWASGRRLVAHGIHRFRSSRRCQSSTGLPSSSSATFS